MTGHALLTCAAADREEAGRLARMLVERRLAACVQMAPIESCYRWRGEIETSAEVVLLIKTRADLAPAVTAALAEAHSYEVPEVLTLVVQDGLPAYLAWIDEATS